MDKHIYWVIQDKSNKRFLAGPWYRGFVGTLKRAKFFNTREEARTDLKHELDLAESFPSHRRARVENIKKNMHVCKVVMDVTLS